MWVSGTVQRNPLMTPTTRRYLSTGTRWSDGDTPGIRCPIADVRCLPRISETDQLVGDPSYCHFLEELTALNLSLSFGLSNICLALSSFSLHSKASPSFSTFLRISHTESWRLSLITATCSLFSRSLNPFTWMIFICLRTVDFPDSPVPRRRILMAFLNSSDRPESLLSLSSGCRPQQVKNAIRE